MKLKKNSIKKINETKRNYNGKNRDQKQNNTKIRYKIENKINQNKGEKQNKYHLKEI